MKIDPAPLHIAQLVLVGLTLCFSIAIIGTAAHTLHVFNSQQPTNPWWLPLWPQHFDTHSTSALIGSAASVVVLNAIFLIFTLIPRFNVSNRPTFRALLALGTALPGSLVMLCTVIYAHILNHNSPDIDTIQTWTCKYKNNKPLSQDLSIPSNMGNSLFRSMCQESKFALYGTLVVFLLLSISHVITIVTWIADKWAQRKSGKEWQDPGAEMAIPTQ